MTTKLWHELEDKQAESLVGGWQVVRDAKITSVGIPWPGSFSVTIDKGHPVTTETASCERGKFVADMGDGYLFGVAKDFKKEGKPIDIYYSEYVCYQGAYPGSKKPMLLISIDAA